VDRSPYVLAAARNAILTDPPSSSLRRVDSYADQMPGRTQAVYYRDNADREPVNGFIDALARTNPATAAKIDEYVEQYLNGKAAGAPPPVHPISSGRRRTAGAPDPVREDEVPDPLSRSGLLVVLLHIFERNTDKLPARDRELAIRRFTDFKARMGAEPRRPPRAAGRDAPPRTRGR